MKSLDEIKSKIAGLRIAMGDRTRPSELKSMIEVMAMAHLHLGKVRHCTSDEYARCALTLEWYRLLALRCNRTRVESGQDVHLNWKKADQAKYGTDFYGQYTDGMFEATTSPLCVLGGVWFTDNKDRREAIELCEINQAFQDRCRDFGLGGA